MASKTDPIAPKTWVAIDVAKGINVALIEQADGRLQRWRFANCRDDHYRLVDFLHKAESPCRIVLEPTADYHRTIAHRLVSEGFDVVFVSSVAGDRLRSSSVTVTVSVGVARDVRSWPQRFPNRCTRTMTCLASAGARRATSAM
jgi:hypothetical protein